MYYCTAQHLPVYKLAHSIRYFVEMKNNRRIVLLAAIVLLWSTAFGQDSPELKILKQEIASLKQDPSLKQAMLGICVLDGKTGKILASLNKNSSLLTASTMKTVTSGAAMSILGPDFRFRTYLEYDGEISAEGVLEGNLYLRGSGDPSLGAGRITDNPDHDEMLKIWTDEVRKAGIKSIEGAVIGDASIFEDAMPVNTWPWIDMGNYYAAGACGLTFNENLYYLHFKTGKTGSAVELIKTEPAMSDIKFINEIKSGASGTGDNGYVYGAPYAYLRYLRGTLPPNRDDFSIKGSMPDPAWYAAKALSSALKKVGISTKENATTIRHQNQDGLKTELERKEIYIHQSPALSKIIWWLNKKSINLYAESLLKYLGHFVSNEGSTSKGADVVVRFWAKKGVDTQGMFMADGSGLSRSNGVTPLQMTSILRAMSTDKHFAPFFESLPRAGVASDPGSLRNLCKGTVAANNLRAKSGFISRVRGYVGYVKDQSGRPLVFALLANNYTCANYQMRQKFEKLMIKIAELKK